MTTQPALLACPDCDLLVDAPARPGLRAHCPRCHAVVAHPPSRFPQLSLAAGLTGLILFIPATGLPIMQFTLAGQTGSNTLAEGVLRLWQEGFPPVVAAGTALLAARAAHAPAAEQLHRLLSVRKAHSPPLCRQYQASSFHAALEHAGGLRSRHSRCLYQNDGRWRRAGTQWQLLFGRADAEPDHLRPEFDSERAWRDWDQRT